MKPTERKVVNEILNKEHKPRPYMVTYLIGKPSRKYGTVWRDTEHQLPVMAKDREHARRQARLAITQALHPHDTKLKISIRTVSDYAI